MCRTTSTLAVDSLSTMLRADIARWPHFGYAQAHDVAAIRLLPGMDGQIVVDGRVCCQDNIRCLHPVTLLGGHLKTPNVKAILINPVL